MATNREEGVGAQKKENGENKGTAGVWRVTSGKRMSRQSLVGAEDPKKKHAKRSRPRFKGKTEIGRKGWGGGHLLRLTRPSGTRPGLGKKAFCFKARGGGGRGTNVHNEGGVKTQKGSSLPKASFTEDFGGGVLPGWGTQVQGPCASSRFKAWLTGGENFSNKK